MMNTSALLMGILPLLLFVIVDSFAGLKAALFTAILAALAEAGLTLYTFGELDSVTACSVLLVIVFAMVSFHKKDQHWIKIQPVVLSCFFAAVLLVTSWTDQHLLYKMVVKYQHIIPNLQTILQHPQGVLLLKRLNHFSGYAMLAHAAVTYWAAIKLSNWWWIAIRGIGFYAFMLLAWTATIISIKM